MAFRINFPTILNPWPFKVMSSATLGQVLHGQVTNTFQRHALPALASLSFSLVYAGGEGGLRTLDLIARSERDFELWSCGLQARPRASPATAACLPEKKEGKTSIYISLNPLNTKNQTAQGAPCAGLRLLRQEALACRIFLVLWHVFCCLLRGI